MRYWNCLRTGPLMKAKAIPGQRHATGYEHLGRDILSTITEEHIGYDGMKIDRMFFDKFRRHSARK